MRIITANRQPKYLLITVLATLAMLIVYPAIQSLGQVAIWFAVIEPANLAVYVIFSILFGLLVSLQVYTKREAKACPVGKSAGFGSVGTLAGFFIAQCPTCALLLSLFLPFPAILLVSQYNLALTLGSMALLLLGIHLLGGFRK